MSDKARYTIEGLYKVKVGDLLAPIRVYPTGEQSWGHMAHPVQRVTEKRIHVCGYVVNKADGRKIVREYGYGYTLWVVATPEMLAEIERRKRNYEDKKASEDAFNARTEVKQARFIQWLDIRDVVKKLDPKEIAEFAIKLGYTEEEGE